MDLPFRGKIIPKRQPPIIQINVRPLS